MTYRSLEDNLNLWLNELSCLESDFHQQASTINAWDSLLVNNALKITRVNETIEKLKADQMKIDHQLDFIISQQNELEQLLLPLENLRVEAEYDPATAEREVTYNTLESVHNDLQGIGSDLQDFVQKLNETKSCQDSASNDPLSAINKILNSHMDALQYIDTEVSKIKTTLNL